MVIDEVHSETLFKSSRPATQLTSDILQEILPHLGLYPSEGEIDYGVDIEGPGDEIGSSVEEKEQDTEH